MTEYPNEIPNPLGVPAPTATGPGGFALPPRAGGYFVVIRDANLRRLGAINPTNVRMTMRYNDVSEWSINVPLTHANAELLRTPGAGVLIYRGDDITGAPILTGPIGTRTTNKTEDGSHITVGGPDDLVWVSGRVAYQMPTRAANSQGNPTTGALTHDRRSGAAETVIKGYVDANAGQAALSYRRRVIIEPDQARGATVSGSARMTPLLDLIKPLAATGGLGFKVVQTEARQLEFQTYVPADRTKVARFGTALGNIADWSLFERAPSVTRHIVGGQGSGTARTFAEQADTQAATRWPGWYLETFSDRKDTDSTNEINQTLAEHLLEGGPHESVTVETRDTERLRFGRDYRMGDKVSVEPWPGRVITDVVREVEIDWTVDDGEIVLTRVGTVETTGSPAIVKLARKLKVKSEAVETVD